MKDKPLKIFMSGRITDYPNYASHFGRMESFLKNFLHHIVINPTFLPIGMEYEDYMTVCRACISVSDAVFFLDGWEDSRGAQEEFAYATEKGKLLLYEKTFEC